jgi:hypothetical protein
VPDGTKTNSTKEAPHMQFTFYGDLLGIGSAYKLGAKTAYDKLNAFYNESFRTLINPGFTVEMYSDSLLVVGDDATNALTDIALLFATWFEKDSSCAVPWSREG